MRTNMRRSRFFACLMAATANLLIPSLAAAAPAPAMTEQTATHWDKRTLDALIRAVEAARAEGLNPSDYGLAALRKAADDDGAMLNMVATSSALALAHDYLFGRVTDREDMEWMIERPAEEAAQLPTRLKEAVEAGRVEEFLQSLLPTDPRYAGLRSALNGAGGTMRDRLRVNMERWRWMPRATPATYLYVNVPSYKLQVIEDGFASASYPVVVGAKDTPTPQMVSPTGSLVVNPPWIVPDSIVKKSGLRPGRGYVLRAMPDGVRRLVQPPGPRNALGRIKFNLANDQAIYLHDTNLKAAFRRDVRALSHGCIRVKDIDQLAAQLMSDGGDPGSLDAALAADQTTTIRLPRTWPVYLVYFTADVDETGNVVTYGDPYGYDTQVSAALGDRAVQMASN